MFENVTISTVVSHWDLYEYTKLFLPTEGFQIHTIDGTKGKYSLEALIEQIETIKTDYLVLIDEDAFITNMDRFKTLIEYCIINDFDVVGQPDGGTFTRQQIPCFPNNFFIFLNLRNIKKIYDRYEVLGMRIDSEFLLWMADRFPIKLMKYKYTFHPTEREPYWWFYAWCQSKNLKFYWLDSDSANIDDTSSLLYNQHSEPFIVHSWFGRDWEKHHHDRIMNVINVCKKIRGIP